MTLLFLSIKSLSKMSAFKWRRLPATARLCLPPDDEGDLIFTGLAGRIDRSILSNGIQFDASWAINDSNVLVSTHGGNGAGGNE
jgi:hypothetical protein